MGTQISAMELQKLAIAPIAADGGVGTVFEEVPVVHEATLTMRTASRKRRSIRT